MFTIYIYITTLAKKYWILYIIMYTIFFEASALDPYMASEAGGKDLKGTQEYTCSFGLSIAKLPLGSIAIR